MRNLPQTFKVDGNVSDDSYESICPSQWTMSPDMAGMVRSTISPITPNAHLKPMERNNSLFTYLIKHRVRLLLTIVSLIFLSLFLLIIYRQFGVVIFGSTLALIVVPGLVALLYARRLSAKEQEQARQRALNRGHSQRSSQHRPTKTVQIYSTDLEMSRTNKNGPVVEIFDHSPYHKLQRKGTQQKITIQLPPLVVTDHGSDGEEDFERKEEVGSSNVIK